MRPSSWPSPTILTSAEERNLQEQDIPIGNNFAEDSGILADNKTSKSYDTKDRS